jgi:hypothetical protein
MLVRWTDAATLSIKQSVANKHILTVSRSPIAKSDIGKHLLRAFQQWQKEIGAVALHQRLSGVNQPTQLTTIDQIAGHPLSPSVDPP